MRTPAFPSIRQIIVKSLSTQHTIPKIQKSLRARLLVSTSATVSAGGALVSVAQRIDSSATHVVQVLRLHVDSAQLVAQSRSLDVLHLGNLNSVGKRSIIMK